MMHRNTLLSAPELLLLLAKPELQVCWHGVAGEAAGRRAHGGAGHGLFQPFLPPAAAEEAGEGLRSVTSPPAAT